MLSCHNSEAALAKLCKVRWYTAMFKTMYLKLMEVWHEIQGGKLKFGDPPTLPTLYETCALKLGGIPSLLCPV